MVYFYQYAFPRWWLSLKKKEEEEALDGDPFTKGIRRQFANYTLIPPVYLDDQIYLPSIIPRIKTVRNKTYVYQRDAIALRSLSLLPTTLAFQPLRCVHVSVYKRNILSQLLNHFPTTLIRRIPINKKKCFVVFFLVC